MDKKHKCGYYWKGKPSYSDQVYKDVCIKCGRIRLRWKDGPKFFFPYATPYERPKYYRY